jgi:hypothetical protein
MTDLFDKALAVVRRLNPGAQDEIARLMLMLANGYDERQIIPLTPEDAPAITLSQGESDRGEFASDEEAAAVWLKHGVSSKPG